MIRKLVLGLLLLCVATSIASAALVRDGSCGATGTNCTVSATTTGSVRITFAYRQGSTTPPTLPSGWTTLSTLGSGATGTIGSLRVGCAVSTSSSDTSSGAWTNATYVASVSYSGTSALSTNCLGAIGYYTGTSQQTSTNVQWQLMSQSFFWRNDSSSWVVTFAGASAAIPGTAPSLTSVVTAGSSNGLRIADSNAGIYGYNGGQVTVASSTWMTYELELLSPVSLAGNQENRRPTADSSWSCGTPFDGSASLSAVYSSKSGAGPLGPAVVGVSTAADTSSNHWSGRLLNSWQTPSGSYSASALNVDWACSISGAGGGECYLQYSINSGSTWTYLFDVQTDTGRTLSSVSLGGVSSSLVQVRACAVSYLDAAEPGNVSFSFRDIYLTGTLGSSTKVVGVIIY